MNILRKIQSLPEVKRKVILWTIIIVISLILLVFWIKDVRENLKKFPKEEFKGKFQSPFEEKLKEMPKIEMPEINFPEMEEKEMK